MAFIPIYKYEDDCPFCKFADKNLPICDMCIDADCFEPDEYSYYEDEYEDDYDEDIEDFKNNIGFEGDFE